VAAVAAAAVERQLAFGGRRLAFSLNSNGVSVELIQKLRKLQILQIRNWL